MSQPTQVLPSWLTLSTTVVTLPDGSLSTSSDILRLPLTYYGPSIPLGTDGVWTYGGLTPPPSTTSTPTSATPTSTSVSSAITSAPTIVPTTSATSASITLSSTSSATSSSSSSSSTAAIPTVASQASHGISPATLGAILGSVLGSLLLLVLIAIIFLIRSNRRRQASKGPHGPDGPDDPQDPSSSFWNRSTTLMSFRNSTVPIWTGWELVDPDDAHPPGEGSPRGSGEEEDPFLTRRSVHSGTEMGQTRTDTDTLVSLPAIARSTVSTHHSAPKPGGHIIPRDVQMRLDEEMGDAPPYPSIRMVERRPSDDQSSPLLPPPPLDSLEMGGRRASLGSEKSKVTDNARSIMSEKSGDTDVHEPEGAELLIARRVKVGQIQPLANPGPSTSVATPNVLGLDRLANLGRMSWFKRMSFIGAPAGSQPVAHSDEEAAASDSYTRTPPRHSRNGSSRSRPASHSRPGSFARVSAHDPTPTTDSFGRRLRHDSGLGFGLTDERPISTVSAQSAASGNTVFYDANSRPGSSMGTRSTGGSGSSPIPPVPPVPQAHLAQPSPLSHEVRQSSASISTESSYGEEITDRPPTYETATAPQSRTGLQYSDIDVLDMPAPRPASPFSQASGSRAMPPGLGLSMDQLPNPVAWRNSHASSGTPTDGTSGITIDVLEEAPPAAQGGWRSLAGGLRPTDGRRTTFGVPMVVQPQDVLQSERGSLHSTRSHLSPHSSRSPSGSAPASSRHTGSGSSSSRPTASSHSRGITMSSGASLAHSNSVSFDDHRPGRHRAEAGEIASPPLSAVFGAFPRGAASPPPPVHGHGDDVVHPAAPAYHSSAPSPIPMPSPVAVSGTVTSTATRGTADESLTDLSVTTTQTDPITGAVVHLPRLPWRSGNERAWGERPVREDTIW
ncbi:hypothetical protein L226DRAFT_575732 [Lentinus tigrinus ALCF2SS1-7]|uniref:Uncharacterized protein n=1 Tax=Lentinus tigrinus ALCF2SS1-6 TaxID=1328759 RepID=A0A5C2RRS0_9APHY|nr:hypothetical protein L227DRAFT_511835 [Lentinus tigrinus ALCF2SS1-6]RPD69266.1 hypothetical protein L226DRAFT_575732 [Lentinus tigrinus ALCF2SS1-7]